MPLINLKTSLDVSYDHEELLIEFSKEISRLTNKPEHYVMTIIEKNIPMSFAGSTDPCAYVDMKSIGSLQPREMSQSICNIINKFTGISPSRIYINFVDISADKWGFNSSTFG